MKMKALFIEGRRNGYAPDQCGHTMTVSDLIDYLEGYPEDLPVYLINDGGYTYGNINYNSFDETVYSDGYDDDDEDEDEDY